MGHTEQEEADGVERAHDEVHLHHAQDEARVVDHHTLQEDGQLRLPCRTDQGGDRRYVSAPVVQQQGREDGDDEEVEEHAEKTVQEDAEVGGDPARQVVQGAGPPRIPVILAECGKAFVGPVPQRL